MTTKNTCSLIILVAVATAVICATAVVCSSGPSPAPADPSTSLSPSTCPWRRVLSPEDPFIQKLGRWAVDHQDNGEMNYKKVESAKWQGIGQQCGNMFFHSYYYELTIVGALLHIPGVDGDDQKFRAVVYVVNFSQPEKLISFSRYFRPPVAN